MAQTKLLNIINSIAAQIGDPSFETYAQAEVLTAVNMARGKVYNDNLLRICGEQSVAQCDIGIFAEIFPEWVAENVLFISNITGSTTLTIKTKKPHRLISGQLITISTAAGFTANPNGDFAVLGSNITENQFEITHTVVGGTYTANTGKIVCRLSNNEIPKPIDCRRILSGILNASTPVITNGQIKRLSAEVYHEAKFNTYSTFAPANDNVKMYQKNDTIEVLAAAGAAITGNVQLIYVAEPVDAVVDANYNDIVDPVLWEVDIIDLASDILMSYQLQ